MAEKILYLLGAGASAEALPLAKNPGGQNPIGSLHESIRKMANDLVQPNSGLTINREQKSFCEKMLWSFKS